MSSILGQALFTVCRKNLISSLRGEYVDFIVSRFTFTIFTIVTALVLYRLKGNQVSSSFIQSTGHNNYLGFIVIGTALYGTTHGILLNVSRTLMTERREGTLEAVLLIPFSRWQFYGGNQLFQFMLTGLDFMLAFFMAALLGVRFHYNLPGVIASLVQIFITLYGLALLISLLMITLKDTFFIQNTIIPVILLIGGYLFPVEVLPVPFKILSEIIPVYKGVYMFRDAVLIGQSIPINREYFLSLVPGLIFLMLGFLMLSNIERKAMENYLS